MKTTILKMLFIAIALLLTTITSSAKSLPSFSALWSNYPADNSDGSHAKPSSDSYAYNQCAIRMSVALIGAGVSLKTYPKVNKTTEGFARSSKGLADWLWKNYGRPTIMKQADFDKIRSKTTGIYFQYTKPTQANPNPVNHIDLNNKGSHHGYYLSDDIWYWEL